MVDGLESSEEKHSIYLDVEPRTGAPLNGGKRLQFNMFLKVIDHISEFFSCFSKTFYLTKFLFSRTYRKLQNSPTFPRSMGGRKYRTK